MGSPKSGKASGTAPGGGCPACGTPAGPDSRFCRRCGARLEDHLAEDVRPGARGGAGKTLVIVLSLVVLVGVVALALFLSSGGEGGDGPQAGDGQAVLAPPPTGSILQPAVSIDVEGATSMVVGAPVVLPSEGFDLGARVEGLVDIGDGSLVAVGSGDTIESLDPTVWRSSDSGLSWALVLPPADPSRDEVMADVAVSAEGQLVAVGYLVDRDPDSGLVLSEQGAVWTSDDDGLTWQGPVALPPDLGTHEMLSAVVVGGGGRLVAVGRAGDGDVRDDAAPAAAAFWTSDDGGDTWTGTIVGDVSDRVAQAESVAFDGSRFVAVGFEDLNLFDQDLEDSAAVWTSADGETWRLGPTPLAGVVTSMDAIVWLDGGYLVGRAGGGAATSPDGNDWAALAIEGAGTSSAGEDDVSDVLSDGAVVGDELLFGGYVSYEDGTDPAVYRVEVR